MRPADPLIERALAVAADQAGIIARRQLIALGLSAMEARRGVASGRWRVVVRGVYATFTGPLPPMARIWAAVLYAGGGAAAERETALWLAGVTKASSPPRVRLEDALLDACDATSSVDACLTLIFSAVQKRLTTPDRLRKTLDGRLRNRWRELIGGVLHDADKGVTSALERRYLRDVEQRHQLPEADRNEPETDTRGKSVFRDVRYGEWSTLVELDGREAHPPESKYQDRRRDNRSTIDGDWTLRYGWHDVAGRPCEVAFEVCTTLRGRGWRGWGEPCGPACDLDRRPG